MTATLGDWVNLAELENIASLPWSANLLLVDNYTLWQQLVTELVTATCDSTRRSAQIYAIARGAVGLLPEIVDTIPYTIFHA